MIIHVNQIHANSIPTYSKMKRELGSGIFVVSDKIWKGSINNAITGHPHYKQKGLRRGFYAHMTASLYTVECSIKHTSAVRTDCWFQTVFQTK